MNKNIVIAALVSIGYASAGAAQCELGDTIDVGNLTSDNAKIRGAIYQELCRKSGGDLVDGDDLSMRARLKFSQGRIRQDFWVDEDLHGKIAKSKVPVVLAYTVESTGKVSWVAVLQSSGDKQLDEFAMKLTGAMQFGRTTLDGQPVRLFRTMSRFGPPPP